jgi:hypothetical protein
MPVIIPRPFLTTTNDMPRAKGLLDFGVLMMSDIALGAPNMVVPIKIARTTVRHRIALLLIVINSWFLSQTKAKHPVHLD